MAKVYQDPKEEAIYEEGKKQGADDFFQLLLVNVYARKVQDFHNYNTMARKGGIVFLGDSITDNYDVYEYYHGYDVYNRGIGGDTSEGVLKRLQESVYELEPKVVVLLIGTNDFQLCENHQPADILARIKLICESIHAHLPKTEIILESIYPVYNGENPKVDSLSVGSKTNSEIDKTNLLLKAYQQPYIHYLDVNSALKGPDGNVQLDYTMEGLHTSTTGYFVVTRLVKEALKELGVVSHER
jgi:Lysophospholipase L1 and related esterases